MELEPFLVRVGDGDASGSELRNDPRFHAVERLLEPAARSFRLENIRTGGTGSVAIDWSEILSQSADLAPTGRDIRLLVIVARALANDPPLIVADEPTGNLDSNTALAVVSLFEELARHGKTVLMVTHDPDLAQRANRLVRIADGQIVEDSAKRGRK